MKKSSKMAIFAAAALILSGFIFAGVAFAAGAGKAENWKEANMNLRAAQGMLREPLFKSEKISGEVTGLKIENSSHDMVITLADVTETEIDYYADYEDDKPVTLDSGVLGFKFPGRVNWLPDLTWMLYDDYGKINIRLPLNTVITASDLYSSSGSISITGMDLGEVSRISVASGLIKLENCTASDITKINVSSGDVTMSGTYGDIGSISVASGLWNGKDSALGVINKINVSSGTAKFTGAAAEIKEAQVASGSLKIGTVTGGDKFTASVSSGNLTVSSINAKKVSVTVFSGNADITSGANPSDYTINDRNDYTLKVSSGDLTLRGVPFTRGNLLLHASASSGDVYFNGKRAGDLESDEERPCIIRANVSSGTIRILTASGT